MNIEILRRVLAYGAAAASVTGTAYLTTIQLLKVQHKQQEQEDPPTKEGGDKDQEDGGDGEDDNQEGKDEQGQQTPPLPPPPPEPPKPEQPPKQEEAPPLPPETPSEDKNQPKQLDGGGCPNRDKINTIIKGLINDLNKAEDKRSFYSWFVISTRTEQLGKLFDCVKDVSIPEDEQNS